MSCENIEIQLYRFVYLTIKILKFLLQVCVLNGDHTEPVRCVQFNPKYMMMASACKNMAFWLPSVDEDA